MMFKSIILGGAAAVALTCGGFVASSFAQTQAAPADQSAPAASSPATPATQAAPAEKPAADESGAATKHVKHHHRSHVARRGSTKQERAETQKLNQDQLAKAQAASQGRYGTMEQQQPGSEPGNMNNAPAPSTSNDTGGPNTAAPSDKTAAPNTTPPPANTPQAPNPSSPPQKP